MTSTNKEINRQTVLTKIKDLDFKNGEKLLDRVSQIVINERDVGFSIDITGQTLEEAKSLQEKATQNLHNIENIGKISIVLTSKKGDSKKAKHSIDGISKIILVAAGKGGVGKSTITALLAEKLNLAGYKVGIADADIYGPSIPQIFGLSQMPEVIDKKMIPLVSRSIAIISIGFLTKDEAPIAWRGPMASKAIYQILSSTKWGQLDYLLIDMPPGTGDIHLSILENYNIDGAVIVTTPQILSQKDVVKAIELYKKFRIPIKGIIENMSYFLDASRNKIEIFNGNSGSKLASKYNVPLIAKIPINPLITSHCDQGLALTELADFELDMVVV